MPGLPKSIIKKYGVTKKAWAVFRGRHRKHSSSPKTHRSVTHHMARKKRHGGGGKSLVRSIEKLIPPIALAAPAVVAWQQGGPTVPDKMNHVISRYTGYSIKEGVFQWDWLAQGWTPFIVSKLAIVGVHKVAGLIRRL